MRRMHRGFALLALVGLSFAALPVASGSPTDVGQAQGPLTANTESVEVRVGEPVTPQVVDVDIRTLPIVEPWEPGDPVREFPKRVYPRPGQETEAAQPVPPSTDPLLSLQENTPQGPAALDGFSTPILNFGGFSFTGAFPPDTEGDVGPNHYIQMVNDGIGGGSVVVIFDKSGTVVHGPFALHSLAPGGNCTQGDGDPIVLYDRLADRWLLSEFADVGNHLCVYISQTSDPVSGGWYLYDFATPEFPDYPKYAVWPDAYYVSANQTAGPAAYALNREDMLVGGLGMIAFVGLPSLAGFGFQAMTPSDLDGALPPPVGAPNYFMRHRDDEAHNPGSNDPTQDYLEIWEFHVDWSTPANSSFSKVLDLPVTEFDSNLCGLTSQACFPQPGTSTTVDPIREVIMWRLQYRNFGVYETLVGNFVTDVDGTDHGGIRWFELRKAGGSPWSLFQEGTYAPDERHRWLGSIGMDGSGNIALGYSISSDSIYPGIRYTGRLAGDPVGTLARGEYTITNGAGSQSLSSRWGDYSAMSVDPADDCTFWYTNEYIAADGFWETRIAAFKFPQCWGSNLTPDIELIKTVGLDPAGCASTEVITVPVGTDVTYCYHIFNTGELTLTLHDLEDSQLGTLFSGVPYTLTPGADVSITFGVNITRTTVNTATWTAYNPLGPIIQAADAAMVVAAGEIIYSVYLPLTTRGLSP